MVSYFHVELVLSIIIKLVSMTKLVPYFLVQQLSWNILPCVQLVLIIIIKPLSLSYQTDYYGKTGSLYPCATSKLK